jgi:prolyl oligopeptidase
VIDLDELNAEEGIAEGEQYVWHGYSLLDEGPQSPWDRALVFLSPGGTDAQIAREFDLRSKSFVPDGFRTETAAKAARVGIWRGYVKPVVDGVSEAHGTVVEVVTGDTCTILMGGETYTSDEKVRMDMNWKSIAKIKICPSLSLFI